MERSMGMLDHGSKTRVHQPQRMFHPEGWAAGELISFFDGMEHTAHRYQIWTQWFILFRKSSTPTSVLCMALVKNQRRGVVQSMEGWYLLEQ